jgi:Pro-Pro endopeptidase
MARFYHKLGLTLILASTSVCAKNLPDVTKKPEVKMEEPSQIETSSDEVKVNYRLNVKERDQESIDQILGNLEKVPDAYQKIGNDFEGMIVIFDGNVTDNPSMESWKGKQIPKWKKGKTYDILPGVYSITWKEALIKQNYSEKSHGSVNLELHEDAHLIDHALGVSIGLDEISSSKPFRYVHKISKAKKDKFGSSEMDKYEYDYRDEFWAEIFAKFYYSSESREKLKDDLPDTHKYFVDLEVMVTSGKFSKSNYLEQFNYSADEPDDVQDNKGPAGNRKCVIY